MHWSHRFAVAGLVFVACTSGRSTVSASPKAAGPSSHEKSPGAEADPEPSAPSPSVGVAPEAEATNADPSPPTGRLRSDPPGDPLGITRLDQAAERACTERYRAELTADDLTQSTLVNAAACFEKAGAVGKAIQLGRELLKRFPEAVEVRDTLVDLGQGYERIGVLPQAAEYYEIFAQRFAKDERAPELLKRAMCLRADLTQNEQANADAHRLLRSFRLKASPERDCPGGKERYARVVAAELRTQLFRAQCDVDDHACRCTTICTATVIQPPKGGAELRFNRTQTEVVTITVETSGSSGRIQTCDYTRADDPSKSLHQDCSAP